MELTAVHLVASGLFGFLMGVLLTSLLLMLKPSKPYYYNPNAKHYCPLCQELEEDCQCLVC